MIIVLGFTTILLLAYCGLLLYYLGGWRRLQNSYVNLEFKPSTGISVLIPARNEEENLPALLDGLYSQHYPNDLYEVIVLDDFSDDRTAQLTEKYGGNFLTLSLSEHLDGKINSYKKKAIELGIGRSHGDLIVTTDADCLVKNNWLHCIAMEYEEKRSSMIVMPVKMTGNPGFLSVFQSLDFMSLQGVTAASAGLGQTIMCNGANLAYEKKSFNEVRGFEGIDELASGDDMMLLHKMSAAGKKISYLKNAETIVSTKPMTTINDFINQRVRWASKSTRYSNRVILQVLILIYFLNLLLLIIPFLILFGGFDKWFVLYWLGLIIVKTMIELVFLWPVAGFYKQRNLLAWFPLAQPFHILYTVIAGFLGIIGKYTWKGRSVK